MLHGLHHLPAEPPTTCLQPSYPGSNPDLIARCIPSVIPSAVRLSTGCARVARTRNHASAVRCLLLCLSIFLCSLWLLTAQTLHCPAHLLLVFRGPQPLLLTLHLLSSLLGSSQSCHGPRHSRWPTSLLAGVTVISTHIFSIEQPATPEGGQASSRLPQGARPGASAPLPEPRAPWASYHRMLGLPVPTCACHGVVVLPPVPSRHLLIEQITPGPQSPADKFPGQSLSLRYGPVGR